MCACCLGSRKLRAALGVPARAGQSQVLLDEASLAAHSGGGGGGCGASDDAARSAAAALCARFGFAEVSAQAMPFLEPSLPVAAAGSNVSGGGKESAAAALAAHHISRRTFDATGRLCFDGLFGTRGSNGGDGSRRPVKVEVRGCSQISTCGRRRFPVLTSLYFAGVLGGGRVGSGASTRGATLELVHAGTAPRAVRKEFESIGSVFSQSSSMESCTIGRFGLSLLCAPTALSFARDSGLLSTNPS
eukprot:SAG11_NODE_7279_length_1167_cov_0.843633_2_plen_246_part_00